MVRCADCGYLAIRDYKTRALIEVEASVRQTGLQPSAIDLPGRPELV
jgi:hypothetical protein